MDKYFPFIFNLEDKMLLFIGGGKVAEKKIIRLYRFSNILVVSPKVTAKLKDLYNEGSIGIKYKKFENSDINKNVSFVFACTNDKELNREIALLCKGKKIFVLDASDKKYSDFFMPAVYRSHDFLIATSTFGDNPKSAALLRDKIKKFLLLTK
ncbi:MAG: bifunctional precorrin-2 dehydrogenase/sirohydrochlorin ferrochelatase [Deferribacterota bacterium]|nr:bifunctional precorrin-2 dehydrogenase/sirohydrochlorin ferrochelatase [Deferribacterota bacterium]